jgi:7-cyano-7-deazaguanine synthase in queuosine biosynthesis
MGKAVRSDSRIPCTRIEVHESGTRIRAGWLPCKIGETLEFSTEELASYCFAKWEPVVFDALLVAAAVEFCDRSVKRATHCWARDFHVRIPAHDPSRWNNGQVSEALHEALSFLTGDKWLLEFVPRIHAQPEPLQSHFQLPNGSHAIIPFSDGMDSRAVAGLMSKTLGGSLVRVRLGSKRSDMESITRFGQPFASVPYRVHEGNRRFAESSARSRGFKFATISGVTAYLSKAEQIIVPESGQGSLGPSLTPVGQAYEDYRNHPLFTDTMEKYLGALFHHQPRFEFPRLWNTKAETLKEFVDKCPDGHTWEATWSCWQSARQASVDGHKRQCGICAACMLRRQSVHAAGLTERKENYIWENLNVPSFEKGAAKGFHSITRAFREYAIAGTLHLDHLAAIRSSAAGRSALALCAFQLSRSRRLPEEDVKAKLDRLLDQHEHEWAAFMKSLGKQSFLAAWAAHTQ